EYAGLFASLDSITVDGFAGDDTIVIEHVPISVPVSVSGGDGNDSIIVVLPPDFLGETQSSVHVDGGAGSDSVTVLNDQSANGSIYTITNSTLSMNGSSFGGLTYSTVEDLTLLTGEGNDAINVNSTAAGVPVTIHAGAGNDVINVGTGNLGTILGGVTVDGGSGTNGVRLFDQSSPYAGPYT